MSDQMSQCYANCIKHVGTLTQYSVKTFPKLKPSTHGSESLTICQRMHIPLTCNISPLVTRLSSKFKGQKSRFKMW